MKLTPKQSLALELLTVKHEFDPEKYAAPSFDDERLIYRLESMAKQSTQAQLRQEIIQYTNLRLQKEKEAEILWSREVYFKTYPNRRESAEKQMESIGRELQFLENDTAHLINKQLHAHGFPFWKVCHMSSTRASVRINMSTTDEELRILLPYEQLRFGYSVDMAFSTERGGREAIPEMNFGSMGSFSLYGTEPDNPRSEFYISIGKMLQDKDLLEYIEGMVLDYKKRHDDLVKIYDSLENFLANPENI